MRFSFLFVVLVASCVGTATAQPCASAQADAYLENAGVRALLLNNGSLFWRGRTETQYEVPKGSGTETFARGAIWIGGTRNGAVRFAGTAAGPWEYWPGPLAEDGDAPTPESCAAYNRIWRVTLEDIARYNTTGEATPDLAEWPAEVGAPVVDGDGDPTNYDLAAGDRPAILGDETAWWIMNDRGGTHNWSETPPIGLEVRVTVSTVSDAYAYQRLGLPRETADLLHTATLHRYELTYRGGAPFQDAYFGTWFDAQLGYFHDNYVGSYPPNHVAYVYNGDDFDEGAEGYGASPPAVGIAMARGPGERLLSSFVYYNSDSSVQGNPSGGVEAYYYLQGRWRDRSRITFGGTGYQTGEETSHMFPDLPTDFWSEYNIDGRGTANIPAARRFVASHGPFTIQPGETAEIRFAIVYSRSDAGNVASARQLVLIDAPRVVAVTRFLAPDPDLATITLADLPAPLPPEADLPEIPSRYAVAKTVAPNPATGDAVLRLDLPEAAHVRLTVFDALGREVSTAVDQTLPAAEHRLRVPASGLPPGVYVYRLEVTPEGLSPLFSTGRFLLAR